MAVRAMTKMPRTLIERRSGTIAIQLGRFKSLKRKLSYAYSCFFIPSASWVFWISSLVLFSLSFLFFFGYEKEMVVGGFFFSFFLYTTDYRLVVDFLAVI